MARKETHFSHTCPNYGRRNFGYDRCEVLRRMWGLVNRAKHTLPQRNLAAAGRVDVSFDVYAKPVPGGVIVGPPSSASKAAPLAGLIFGGLRRGAGLRRAGRFWRMLDFAGFFLAIG